MSFNVSQHVREKKYEDQPQVSYDTTTDLTPYTTERGINLSELARQKVAAEQMARQEEEESRKKKLTDERTSLVEEYKTLRDVNDSVIPKVQRRNEVLARLKELDKELGLDESDYISTGERAGKTIAGATKQSGSGFLNFLGTGVAYLRDLVSRAGGNTSPYAGYATDEVSAANIGYEHDENVYSGFYDASDKFSNTVQAAADKISESASEDLRAAKAGLGKVGTAAVDIGANLIQMGYDAAFGPGSLAAMFVRSAGGKAQEVRQGGGSVSQQFWAGNVSGGIEVLTEKLADGVAGIYGKGTADEAIERMIGKLAKSDFGRTVLRQLTGAASEGVEEVLSDLLDPFVEIIYKDKNLYEAAKDSYNLSDMLYDFIIGAAVGAIGGGASLVLDESGNINPSNSQNVQANQQLSYTDTAREALINKGFDAKNAQEQAENIARQMMGEDLTPEQQRQFDRFPTAQEVYEQIKAGANPSSTIDQQTAEEAARNNTTAEATGQAYLQQVVNDMDVSEADARVLLSGYETGDANPQEYARGIQEAYKAGTLGVDLAQAQEDAVFAKVLNNTQFAHAWQIGAQKAGLAIPETTTRAALPASSESTAAPSTTSIEEFSRKFDNPLEVARLYDSEPSTDLGTFTEGFQRAYDMGLSGVGASYLTDETIPGISAAQRQAAYDMGKSAADTQATAKAETISQSKKTGGNQARVKGTVKGDGVTIADMKKAFNDRQNTAYRLLTRYAETTGVNIVLYNSKADAKGAFPSEQGRFQFKDNAIYVDINSGLNNINDVNDLGKYTMLRTFAHEFTHFIENWNPARYNEFRQFVFDTLEARGENVNDLIEAMQARDSTGKMTYEQASREVVADAMMDILPDTKLVQQLAQEHESIFKQLLNKLRDFAARMQQYYRQITTSAPAEAQALKDGNTYLKSIVDMWEDVAKGAVENYQSVNGEILVDQPAKPDNLPKRPSRVQENSKSEPSSSKSEPSVQKAQENAQETENVPENQAEMPKEPEKEPKNQTENQSDTPEGAKLREALSGTDRAETIINGIRYYISYDNTDRFSSSPWYGEIRKTDGESYTGVAIQNARNLIYSGRYPTREAAVNELVAVAENNHLLEEDTNASAEEPNTPDMGAETGDRSNGAGAVRVSVEQSAGEVHPNAAGQESDTVSQEAGPGTGRDGNRADAERNGRSGSEGSSESGVQPGRESDGLTEQEHKQQAEELHETTSEQIEEKSTELPGGSNFVIGDSLDLPRGEKTRTRANIEAIRLVKQLEAEGRNATPEEQTVLSKYVGWGALDDAFDPRKPEWAKEYAELKEILTDEEFRAARASTNNAHYTSIEVIKAMYKGLDKLGFKGGRMLEPSSGVGNFVGAMPADMTSKVKSWTMVELDNITGLIAKYLYPQNDVRIEGFEKTIIPDNFMDVAIGNVPFGNIPIFDRIYPKKVTAAIHNYFFAKSLDKVRPGGIVMFITSSYTMNSKDQTVRRYIAKQADLLGAIRLPNNAFMSNAGTPVVTDILILKKRTPGTEYAGEAFVVANEESKFSNYNDKFYKSEYFANHPEMIMGEEATSGSMYRRNEYTVNPKADAGTLGEQIEKAFEHVSGQMDYTTQESPEKTNYKVQRAEKGSKQGGYVQRDGKIYQNDGGELKEIQTDSKTAARITGMLGIRDAARELLNAQQQGVDEKNIKALRRNLNKAYDDYVKANGFLNSPANKKAFADDPDRFSLFALENWDSEKKTATKADIFKTDTIKPNRTVTHADTVEDGLTVSRNMTGGIDVKLISKLTGKTEEAVTRELIDSELAYKNNDGQLEPAETYLSGNVRAKLRNAQALLQYDKDYQHNVDALKAIVPKDIPHEQIFIQPGTPWIPESVYSDFAAYMLGGNNYRWSGPDVAIHRSNQTGTFTIDLNNKRLKDGYRNKQEWGTPKRSFLNLLDAMMNSLSVTVTYKDSEGRTIVDRVATDAANEKIEQITKKFQEWMWSDEERTKDLEFLYNETYNNLVTPKYDGEKLTVNGMRAGYSLRPHQADAVQRIISCGGNTLLAHRVGAGKTMEMAAAAMKLKELGIVNKPMFTVPKSLVAQWGKEFSSYFPAAKLLVAEQSDFSPANRKTFANRIATGNYDAIIVSYEQFEKIPISDSYAARLYQEQIDEIIAAIEEAKSESGGRAMSIKDMEKKRKQLEAKVQKLTSKAKDTDTIEFEQLGIDSIFVDEAHNFKNLFYTTSMNNVSGLGNKDGSQRAFDLYTKVRYLQQLNGGRGIVFATATPVMNSMSEMYIMQKYLQSDLLNQLGLSTFDSWAKQFGEVVNGVEIKPSGQGYRIKQSFSRFKNMNELQLLFRNFSDVMTKVPGLKIPRMKGGSVKVVECEAGEFQKQYMEKLTERADNIKHVDPSEDNMLKITSDGRKISYTQRMIDPSLPYEEGCKIYRCADNILEEYKASKSIKGTQIVFCDMATPKGKSKTANAATQEEVEMDAESAQLYNDLKARLVKLGIPAKEIAFIHDADTDAKKSKLFDDVNEGRVRVLIGSTGKMGVGMNAQKRIVAIHHLDAPWRPGDVEQRDGRAFRQGNINEEVSKYVYVTKGSFDARLWDIIDRKSNFINQIMNGENVGRDVEDTGEVTLSAAEVKALASGSPLILEQVQLESDIKKLENLYMAHTSSVIEARKRLQDAKQAKADAETRAENARKDIKHRTEASTDESFSITVGKQTLKDKKAAGKALMAKAMAEATDDTYTKIGTFAGFDILVMHTKDGIIGLLRADGAYKFNTYPDNTTLMITNMQKTLNGLDDEVKRFESIAEQKTQEIKAQENMMNQPFPKQAELDQKRARYNEVMEILNPKEEQAFTDEDEDAELSTRRETMSNHELLIEAAESVDQTRFTEGEKDALRIFRERAERLQNMQTAREDLGKQYKEQQFTKGGSRAEAEAIYNQMKLLDSKIKTLENSLLSLENKDVLKNVLTKARSIAETTERERGQQRLREYRQRRNESEATKKYRDRVRADAETLRKWLVNPSNKDIRQHVPAEIQKTVADFLDTINFASQTALRTGGMETTKADERYLKNMKKMHDAIKHNVDVKGAYTGYSDLPEDFLETFEKLIRNTESLISENRGSFVVNQMSSSDLQTLSRLLKNIKKYIETMNTFHHNAMFQHTYDAGEETIEHLSKLQKSKKSGGIYKFMRFDWMRPSYAFEHFGKGGQSIEHEFREGQGVQAKLANEIIDFAKKTYSAKEVKDWSKETKTFELDNGETVTLPVTHIMSLYDLNKRAQALTHIYGDGIRVANYKDGRNVQLDEGHLVSLNDVQRMISSLSDRQRAVADALQKFMSTEAAKWGNYVSMARFDVEQFTEENYFPINSDGRYLSATADESPDNAGLYALLNSGFTKELRENADNRIILYNIFDVFANHTASMTQYRAFALPVLDALKWFNYQNDTTSVRTKLSSAFGAPVDERAGSGAKGYAESFVLNLLRAYNGTAAQGDPYDARGLKPLHRFNRAQIAFNARVVIQQPMAVTRAAMILSPSKLMKGLSMSATQMSKLAEEMEQYSGIAAWKALGFYDTNISRGLTELIKQNPTIGDQITEIGTKGAETADRFTWAAMWYAAKDSVDKSKYSTNEAYMKAVTELFEEVIYKTQVVDSILTKSEFLRAKTFFPRMLGSFMSEPMTTMSMLSDAYYKYTDDMQRGMSRSEAWQRNGKNIAKTAAVYAMGQILLSAVQSIIDAWRDDDDYATFMEKYMSAFKDNVVEELLPFGKAPYASQAWDLFKWLGDKAGWWKKLGLGLYGNDISNGWMQYANYLKKAAEISIDLIQGNRTNYTWYGAIYNLLRGAAGLTGMPAATAWREVQDVWNNTVGKINPEKKLKTYVLGEQAAIKYAFLDGHLTEDEAVSKILEKGIKDDPDDAYWLVRQWETGETKYTDVKRAIISGNSAEFMTYMDELTSHGVKEKTVYSQLKSFLKKFYVDSDFTSDEEPIVDGVTLTDAQTKNILTKYLGMDSDDATELIESWKFQQQNGFAYSDRKSEYMSGNITKTQARNILSTYGKMDAAEIEETLASWDFEKQHGWAWSERKSRYQKGKTSRTEMYNLLTSYGGMTPEEADAQLTVWDWAKDVPGAENITKSAIQKYNEYCAGYGVNKSVFVQAWKTYNSTKPDYDANGDAVKYSITKKVMPEINKLPISAQQKTQIALCFWANKTVNKYKLW